MSHNFDVYLERIGVSSISPSPPISGDKPCLYVFCLHANPLKLYASPPGVYLECLKVWGGKKRNFIVASRSGDSAGVANCFVSNKLLFIH